MGDEEQVVLPPRGGPRPPQQAQEIRTADKNSSSTSSSRTTASRSSSAGTTGSSGKINVGQWWFSFQARLEAAATERAQNLVAQLIKANPSPVLSDGSLVAPCGDVERQPPPPEEDESRRLLAVMEQGKDEKRDDNMLSAGENPDGGNRDRTGASPQRICVSCREEDDEDDAIASSESGFLAPMRKLYSHGTAHSSGGIENGALRPFCK